MKKFLTLLFFSLVLAVFSVQTAIAQQQTISGVVTSSDDGLPLIGANIVVKGTTTGTITDLDGNYSITVDKGSTLVFSYAGYQTLEFVINEQTALNVSMDAGAQLEEVVVTAFGITREKKSLGYSVEEVGSDELERTAEVNVVSALQGKVSGVQINNSSGTPGAGVDILIRGATSVNPNSSNQPLFVIDGIPISNKTVAGYQLPSAGTNSPDSREQASFTSRIADINMDDVESVSVLKGAAATALYGIRAANGAVIITTKTGSAGKMEVNYKTSLGYENVNKVPGLQTSYRSGKGGATREWLGYTPFHTLGPKVYDGKTPANYNPYLDFFQTGKKMSHSLSISGGNDKITYHNSFSYLKHDGVIPHSDWKRISGKLSGSLKVSDKFKVSASTIYSNTGGVKPHSGDKSIMSSLSYYALSYDVTDYVNPDGSQKNYTPWIDNPFYLAEFSSTKDDVHRVIGNLNFEYKFNDWLTLDYRVGNDFYSDSRKRAVPPDTDVGSQVQGFVIQENINFREINSNLLLKAHRQFSDLLDVNFTLGHAVTDSREQLLNIRGEGFSLDHFYDLSNASSYYQRVGDVRYRLMGVFGVVSFAYNNSLYLDITGRNDWSSALPAQNNSFFFPSVSMAWVPSDAFDLPDWVTFTKLRLSWAKIGKDTRAYQVGSYYSQASGFPFNGTNGFAKGTKEGDVNLEPEFTTSIEVGLNARFLQNRFGFDLTYYSNKFTGLITDVPVSNTTGYNTFVTNSADMELSGVEALLDFTPVRTKSFEWTLNFNFSKNLHSEVTKIAEGVDEILYVDDRIDNKIVVGGAFGDLYGRDFIRNENGELIIFDNGLPYIDYDSIYLVGNAMPDHILGFSNTITYKGFSFDLLFDWRSGGDLYDRGFRNALRNGNLKETDRRYEEVVFTGVNEVYDSEGNLSGYKTNDIPVEIGEDLYRDWRRYNNTYQVLLQDGSWFRLRRASLSYDLPKTFFEKNFISAARLTLSGYNLFLSTPFKGFDPELSAYGAGSNKYGYTGLTAPGVKSYTVSVNVTF